MLTKLKALNEARTKGPWYSERCYGVATIVSKENKGIAHAVEYLQTQDEEFITTSANAMDKLLRVVELAQSLMSEDGAREALTHYNVLFLLMDALKALEQQ